MSIAAGISRENVGLIDGQSPAAIWHKSAPRGVQKAFAAGHESAGWKAWRRHLRTRKRPIEPDQLLGSCLEMRHSRPRLCEPSGTAEGGCATREALHEWLRDAASGQFKLDYALSALGWCRRLPRLAAVLPAKAWWSLLNHLLHAVTEAGAADAGLSADDPLIHQLLAGELALMLAYLFPEITVCRALGPEARRALSAGLADLLDGEGLPHATHFDRLPLLLACWTRCRALANRLKHGCWSHESEKQYRQLVRNSLRLARRDGSHVFSDPATDHSGEELLAAAVALGGDEDDRTLAALVLGGADVSPASGSRAGILPARGKSRQDACFTKKNRRRLSVGLPEATVHSEWAAVAVLRPDWSRSAPRLTVLYSGTSCRVELACGKDVLCSGQWALEVRIDGTPAAPTSEWAELCWVSDDDADYLELEIELGDGLRIQRHLLVARDDRFLLLADAVLAARPTAIQYRGTLPLCPGTTFREAPQTREGLLAGRKPRAMVLPLALPEWLADRRCGEPTRVSSSCNGRARPPCVEDDTADKPAPYTMSQNALAAGSSGLELRQAAAARALFAPLFLDLDRSRLIKPLTWRQLAVAESQVLQPADVAVGYRVAIGEDQWLIYRSLTGSRSRSVLGHNLQSELLVARFDRKGEVETLIEIE